MDRYGGWRVGGIRFLGLKEKINSTGGEACHKEDPATSLFVSGTLGEFESQN